MHWFAIQFATSAAGASSIHLAVTTSTWWEIPASFVSGKSKKGIACTNHLNLLGRKKISVPLQIRPIYAACAFHLTNCWINCA